MTREQAINYLISRGITEYRVSEIVRALTYEPITKNYLGVDCVDRQDVERYIEGFINEYTPREELEFINLELDGLKHIPSVIPQAPTIKNDLGVDCISRADARSLICNIDIKHGMHGMSRKVFKDLYNGIDDLPSVTPQLSVPEVTALAEWTEKLTKASEDAYNKGYADGMKEQEPKTGEWIKQNDDYFDWYECSECGYGSEGEMQYSSEYDVRTNYCPNCGAKMVELQESED